jgi:Sulfatase-modifying factor enzyme 1
MNKFLPTLVVSILIVMGTDAALAAQLTVPNKFVSGTKAVADDVNGNFDAVAAAVNDNDTRITTNSGDISNLTTTVTNNTTAIQVNTTAIGDSASGLTKAVNDNVNAINADHLLINANSAAISTKADASIATTVTSNTSSINTNTANISANTGKINTNTSDISGLQTNVTTNANDIATLQTNVTANTNTLSTHATDITTLQTDDTTNTSAIASISSSVTSNQSAIQLLQQNSDKSGIPCAGNDSSDEMVRVGSLCVDKYEASAWDTSAGGGTEYGVSSADYPCNANGNDCSMSAANPIYARSQAGVMPSTYITQFQALQACANVGKHLLTNAEWQMAAAGTPDPGAGGTDPTASCNTNSGSKSITGDSSGGAQACVSNWGVYDMVGNVHEWVADLMPGTWGTISTGNIATTSAAYGSDEIVDVQKAADPSVSTEPFPGAIYRGGGNGTGAGAGVFTMFAGEPPSAAIGSVGFRCAR